MQARRWMPLVAALVVAAAVPAAHADPTTTATAPTTTAVTVTAPTTTVATTTTTTATTTTAASTTTPATTTTAPPPATTSAPATTATAPPATTVAATPAVHRSLARGCPVAAVALLLPGRAPLLVGPVASIATARAGSSRLAYPANGSIVTAVGVSLSVPSCAAARARLSSLSLFGGAVDAARVTLGTGTAAVSGLTVGGRRTATAAGTRVPLARWGYVVVVPSVPVQVAGADAAGALAVHLTRPHAGLPAGTIVLVTASGRTAVHARRRRRRRRQATHEPLKVTPPLADKHYVFPLVGRAEYGDSYGGFRSDVAGNWHHGDDIFAPLGTPVVAVASGTINRVGWNAVGGWRVWVRDGSGDEFYYAHLSGYAPHDLHSNRVEAGEVIGFVGNTGDAFTTPPHLHFEIHPRQLLHLGYDGAVDPTSYLDRWTHLSRIAVPAPVHPPLPSEPAIRKEAVYVFHELLAARHLIRPVQTEAPVERLPVHEVPVGSGVAAAALPGPAPRPRGSSVGVALLAGIGALLLAAATAAGLELRRRRRA